MLNAFKHVIENVKGNLVLNFDDQNLRELKTSNNCISYSSSEVADIQIQYPNKIIIENEEYVVTTKLIGNHFISNIKLLNIFKYYWNYSFISTYNYIWIHFIFCSKLYSNKIC